MKKTRRWLLGAVLVVIGLCGICCWSCPYWVLYRLAGWDTILSQTTSPDGRYTASVVERSGGGATVGIDRYIILRSNNLLERLTYGDEVVMVGGQPWIAISWKDNQHLGVLVDLEIGLDGPFYTQETAWRDVQITYQTKQHY